MVVDAVGEHGPQPAVERLDAPKQVARAVAVLDGGGMHEGVSKTWGSLLACLGLIGLADA